jgi:vacuolar iron transporter family protein
VLADIALVQGGAGPGAAGTPGMPARGAEASAAVHPAFDGDGSDPADHHEVVGSDVGAALSSFCFFASGAAVPVLPYLFGLGGTAALAVATAAVGVALLGTGAVVGLISGGPPVRRALRQLAIGFGAAAVTYGLGAVFGTTIG